MKNDLVTSVAIAILGVLIAFFTCNLLTGEIQPFSFKSVGSEANTELPEPDIGVFNYRSLNPTVEVYIGNCNNYNENGECTDASDGQIEQGVIEEQAEDELENLENDSSTTTQNTTRNTTRNSSSTTRRGE